MTKTLFKHVDRGLPAVLAGGLALAVLLAGALIGTLAPTGAAWAAESRTLFSHKRWEVRVVAFDDAKLKCVAQVNTNSSSFAIWADGQAPARLQFYSQDWNLGQGSADVIVRIDRRPKWDLTNANLNKQSVLFDLPNDSAGRRFINEVRRGGVIRLGNARGNEVGRWSLSGSSAAVGALSDCVDLLQGDQDDNPFN